MIKRLIILLLLVFNKGVIYGQNNDINNPIENFDKLWNEFNDRYVDFELKNVNWDNIYQKYRSRVSKKTSNDSLFTICSQMINELKDHHVSLNWYNQNKSLYRKNPFPSPIVIINNFPISKDSTPNFSQLINASELSLKDNAFSDLIFSKNNILKYCTSSKYGYLGIQDMEGISKSDLKKFLNIALNDFEEKKGVIIDIRFNSGGFDKIALEIAGRFTDKRRLAYYKRERIKKSNLFTEPKKYFVKPGEKKQFVKPIIIITSDLTASAAEVFTLIMKELPYATQIGDRTMGIFSDKYTFKLPNGWVATLSNEQYLSTSKKNYEGIGIEPSYKLLNKREDVILGTDLLIEKAIKLLDKKTAANNGNRCTSH